MTKKAQKKKKLTAEQIEQEKYETFKESFNAQSREAKAYSLYTLREAELGKMKQLIDNELLILQLKREAVKGIVRSEDEINKMIKEVGEKNLVYDMHFVEPFKVKEEIKKFKESRVETKDAFSNIQNKIDELREIKEKIRKRENAIKAIKQSF